MSQLFCKYKKVLPLQVHEEIVFLHKGGFGRFSALIRQHIDHISKFVKFCPGLFCESFHLVL